MADRDAAQAVFITLKMQADMIAALLDEKALSTARARPLVAMLSIVSQAWKSSFPEGVDLMSDILRDLRSRVGIPED
ncbi:hypothetical protein ABWH89_11010 [Hoeflea alexandrii]|uniref:hypothetical protein n=1 Tax=Hoeflea alexandrii TaxID=288436 RepID=UPI0035CFC63A